MRICVFCMRSLQKRHKTQVLGFKRVFQGGFGGSWGNGYHPQIRKGLMHKKIGTALKLKFGAPPTIGNLFYKRDLPKKRK